MTRSTFEPGLIRYQEKNALAFAKKKKKRISGFLGIHVFVTSYISRVFPESLHDTVFLLFLENDVHLSKNAGHLRPFLALCTQKSQFI